MRNSWNTHGTDVVMSGTLKELTRRIAENLERGMVLVSKPVRSTNLYVEHQYDYSTLNKRSFRGKSMGLYEKWQCKMRYEKENTNI
jgi:hypothetical protein